MKVIEIRDKFGVDSLVVTERPEPVTGPGQVLLKMKAYSVNYRDLLVVNGVAGGNRRSRGFHSQMAWVSSQQWVAAYQQ